MKFDRRLFIAILCVIATGVACSHLPTSQQEREPKWVFKDANDLPENDAKRPRLQPAPPEPSLEVVASEGDCAPKSPNQLAVSSCYKNSACRGHWARTEKNGDVACWCYGVKGGCGEGTVCCSVTHSCTKQENCYVP